MPRSGGRAFADLEAIVWEADPVARVFTAVTGAAAELTGHAPGVWTAAPDFAAALIYPEDRGDALAAFDEAIVSAERRHVEYRVVTADGRVVWLHNAVQPASGDGEGLRGVMLDVTEQKLAERRLMAQYSVTTALADASSLEAAAPAVIEALCDCLGSPQGELWRVDDDGATLRLASTWRSSFAEPARSHGCRRQARAR